MLIDFHTHVFPDKLAPHAMESLSQKAGLQPLTDGTLSFTERLMRAQGADDFVALNIATTPHSEKKVNDFAIATNAAHPAFGSVHPLSENALAELGRLAAAGVKGVKFHHEYQNFFADDERAFPLYEKIEELGLVAVFHGGADPGFAPPWKATPERCARVIGAFPRMKLVVAHLGGLLMADDALTFLKNTPVYIDTAYMAGAYEPQTAERVIKEFGAERVLFGSDCPWDTPEHTFRFLQKLHLSGEETDLIAYKNACRLLGRAE